MHTELCDRFGIQYPIFVFTPSEKVAAAVTRAGGMGVLGAVRFNHPDELESVLCWMDDNTLGLPYGVDIVMPATVPTEGTPVDINKLIPQAHRDFVAKTLADLGVPPLPGDGPGSEGVLGWLHSVARSHVDVALTHPIKLIANALGSPPRDVIDQAHAAGVPVAALAGSAKHAVRHAEMGVDIVVAQGYEAGGHTGEIASMVLVPEVCRCGGGQSRGAGRRRYRFRTTGGRGARTGRLRSVDGFCFPDRSGIRPRRARHRRSPSVIQEALLAATSSDTVRRKIFSGKPARLLKSRWTDAWDADDAPQALPMPLQNILVSEAHQRMSQSADPTTVAMPVGQIVGRMNEIRPVADIMAELVSGFDEATGRLDGFRDH